MQKVTKCMQSDNPGMQEKTRLHSITHSNNIQISKEYLMISNKEIQSQFDIQNKTIVYVSLKMENKNLTCL